MNILAIETSCDETAAAIITGNPESRLEVPKLLSNVVVSQIDIFKSYGGVIPEVAARSHLEAILPVIHRAFQDAGFTKPSPKNHLSSHPKSKNTPPSSTDLDDWDKIDAIAVTHTPGLLGSLLIGTLTARVLAILHHKPLYAVHHLKSHIYANWLGKDGKGALPPKRSFEPVVTGLSRRVLAVAADVGGNAPLPSFPLLALVISGGHTQIIYMKAHNDFKIIGTTLDDAIGECFDKVAKILGLPYPGGPSISKAASGEIITFDPETNTEKTIKVRPGNPEAYPLPHPKIKDLNFSFSGLKTAVLRSVQKAVNVPISYPSYQLAALLTPEQKADFAASFEETACDILLEKLQKAHQNYPNIKSVVIAGGVSANQRLRKKASAFFPAPKFSGDNAAMVGAAAFFEISSGKKPIDPYSLNISPRSKIV